jgi:hypothetical protein
MEGHKVMNNIGLILIIFGFVALTIQCSGYYFLPEKYPVDYYDTAGYIFYIMAIYCWWH